MCNLSKPHNFGYLNNCTNCITHYLSHAQSRNYNIKKKLRLKRRNKHARVYARTGMLLTPAVFEERGRFVRRSREGAAAAPAALSALSPVAADPRSGVVSSVAASAPAALDTGPSWSSVRVRCLVQCHDRHRPSSNPASRFNVSSFIRESRRQRVRRQKRVFSTAALVHPVWTG